MPGAVTVCHNACFITKIVSLSGVEILFNCHGKITVKRQNMYHYMCYMCVCFPSVYVSNGAVCLSAIKAHIGLMSK